MLPLGALPWMDERFMAKCLENQVVTIYYPAFFMVAMLPMNGMPGSYLSYTNARFVDSRFCCHLNDFTVVMALIEPQINPFCSDEYMFSSYCFDDGRQLMKR